MPAHATIAPGKRVQLRLPYVGATPAIVEATGHGELVASLMVPDPRVPRLAGAEATVEWTTERGVERLLGSLELVPGRPDLVKLAAHGGVERIQRREWARVEVAVPLAVRCVDDEACGGVTSTLNLSGGGVLLKDRWRLPLGTDVRLELELEPGRPVRALGRVIRDAGRDEKGVRIDAITREDEERLVRFVRERERRALRMERGG
jgi:c-di-GMP-binding flagellar brake protein YcgR